MRLPSVIFIFYFYPRSPCGERRGSQPLSARPTKDFYPRSPCGERHDTSALMKCQVKFLSTLSLRRATAGVNSMLTLIQFLSTLSLRRATIWKPTDGGTQQKFLSTLSLRRATNPVKTRQSEFLFLSTLSLRRATQIALQARLYPRYFYPRSPCGERREQTKNGGTQKYFYPRSPCGERRKITITVDEGTLISIHALLAESDGGGLLSCFAKTIFLSTLSLRRATDGLFFFSRRNRISIHALLAESDTVSSGTISLTKAFLSTLSLRRATGFWRITPEK